MQFPIAVLLHNIRSAHNVGAIFRTADAAGVEQIFLTGYTPTPIDRFKRPQKDMAKTALGAQDTVPWAFAKTPAAPLARMRRAGWRVVGVEQDVRAIDYRSMRLDAPTLFVFGNEVRGLSGALRNSCDTLIHIPMRGTKESLNVATAAGIILFSALD